MDNPSPSEETIFTAAIELPPAERAIYLDRVCADNDSLRQSVEALLKSHEEGASFLENPPPDVTLTRAAALTVPPVEKTGDRIGRYKLLQQIGEGGCGVVYMAEQQEPVRRQVALKVIKLGMDTKNVIARFEAERQALALMEHPNIAKVLDAGATETGRPYFVMELVRGIKITEFCDKTKLTTQERLKIFIQVCHAVQHARQKGIIHRDLKPSNILVTLNDGVPLPKVIDFGIAKATQQRLTDKTMFTAFEQFIGTPAYMSPEQAEMNAQGVDTRSDIYSLGVLLYELLTGQTPFATEKLLQAGVNEIRRIIREAEPMRPSTKLSTMLAGDLTVTANHRQTEPPKLIHTVHGELDWIVMKALEKDRSRRYETANGFARDVEHYLADEPVAACPPSELYRFQKVVRRHKLVFAAGAAIALSLLIGVMMSMAEAIRARHAEQEQARLRQQADESRDNAKREEQAAREEQRVAAEQELLARRRFYAAQINLANEAAEAGQLARTEELLDTLRPARGQADLRTFEWYYLWGKCNAWLYRTIPSSKIPVYSMAFSPDGKTLASAGGDGSICLWEISTGRKKAALRAGSPNPLLFTPIAFTPDGKTLISADSDGIMRQWDVGSGKLRTTLRAHTETRCLAISPDGNILATGMDDDGLELWNLPSGVRRIHLIGDRDDDPLGINFSQDGKILAAVFDWGRADGIKLWDLTDASPRPKLELAGGGSFALRPDGKVVATANWDELVLWDTGTSHSLATLKAPSPAFTSLVFSPDGNTLASGSNDRTVRLWPLATNIDNHVQSQIIGNHLDAVTSLAISSDGTLLASGANDGSIKLWGMAPDGKPAKSLVTASFQIGDGATYGALWSLFFSPDGKTLIGFMEHATVEHVIVSGENHPLPPGETGGGALSADGKLLATRADDGTVKLWDRATTRLLASVKAYNSNVAAMTFSPDGHFLATCSLSDPTIKVWDAANALKLVWAKKYSARSDVGSTALGFSPDGKTLAVSTRFTKTFLLDATNGEPKGYLTTATGFAGVWATVFSPDGRLLATGGDGGIVKLWDVETGRLRVALKGHTSTIYVITFSADGETVVTGGEDKTIRFWDVATGQERMTLVGLTDRITSAVFSPDGNGLAAGSIDGVVKLWRANRSEEAEAGGEQPADIDEAADEDRNHADWLAMLASLQLDEQKFTQAESSARQCLAIRQKEQPDAWPTFNTRTMLGGSLLGQQKYAEAEPWLLSGYKGMKQRADQISAELEKYPEQALQRLIQLYENTGRSNQIAQWQAEVTWWDRKKVEKLRQAAENEDVPALNALAWLLATSKNPVVRDGTNAVSLAEKAVAAASPKNATYLDTLAAAYAETGQFAKAVEAETEALDELPSDETDFSARLKLYKKNTPYHEEQ